MDHSPHWLNQPPWNDDPIDIAGKTIIIIPNEKRWTIEELRAHKEALLNQIQKEIDKQDELIKLREECLNLAMGLEWLQNVSHKTVSF